jgi:hypothetical protein
MHPHHKTIFTNLICHKGIIKAIYPDNCSCKIIAIYEALEWLEQELNELESYRKGKE